MSPVGCNAPDLCPCSSMGGEVGAQGANAALQQWTVRSYPLRSGVAVGSPSVTSSRAALLWDCSGCCNLHSPQHPKVALGITLSGGLVVLEEEESSKLAAIAHFLLPVQKLKSPCSPAGTDHPTCTTTYAAATGTSLAPHSSQVSGKGLRWI